VITAAASIMIVVFMAFVFAGQRVIGEFGLGLSGAVLLDAFVLRTVLVPAVMHGLGRANWYLPAWLDRVLPHLSIEPPESIAAVVPEPRLEPMDEIDEIVATSLFDVELDDHVGA
jgi:putative drug exporter of the RND superfamily